MSFASGRAGAERGDLGGLERPEPAGRGAERRDNAAVLGGRVRHIERVVIDGYGLADPTALVIEPITPGAAQTHVTREVTGNIAALHGKPKSNDAQFDDFE